MRNAKRKIVLGMELGVVVTCGNDGKYILSLFSLKDCLVKKQVELPLYKTDSVSGVLSCENFVCIHGHKGVIILQSRIDGGMKVLPRPSLLSPPNCAFLLVCGLGLDVESDEYKVIRYYSHRHYHDEGPKGYMFNQYHFEVYSTILDEWKEIGAPDLRLKKGGVFAKDTGSCYWIAASPKDAIEDYVMVGFNFRSEEFDILSLPSSTLAASEDGIQYELVACRGSIGVIVYSCDEQQLSIEIFSSASGRHEIFLQPVKVLKALWEKIYDVALPDLDLERPLGLHDDHLLSLEARPSGGRSQLLLYDLDERKMEKLDIYNYPRPISGKGGFALIHMDPDSRYHCLSLIAYKDDFYVAEKIETPVDVYQTIGVIGYFHQLCICGSGGGVFLYNIEVNQFESLPPLSEFPSSGGCLRFCGFGYDAKSGDQKIICNYSCYYVDEMKPGSEHFELFSFSSYSWKSIPSLDFILKGDGVYIESELTASCYWSAYFIGDCSFEDLEERLGSAFHDCSYKDMCNHVVSFNFETEKFGHLRLPTTCGDSSWEKNTSHTLVGLDGGCGCLGDIVRSDKGSSIQLFVWEVKNESWRVLYDVSLSPGVYRPLGIQDDHLLFLKAGLSGGRSRLIVYDLHTQTSKKLDDIFPVCNSILHGIAYFESVEEMRKKGKEMVFCSPNYVAGESSLQHGTS